jgi:DNA-binding XRE family transcriptional regulator
VRNSWRGSITFELTGSLKREKSAVVEQRKLDYELLDRWIKYMEKPTTKYPHKDAWLAMMKKPNANAQEAKKLADEDLKQFVDLDRPLLEKSAHFRVKIYNQYLEYAREELNWTQEDLADKAGIHRTYLSDVERGSRNVSLINIERLADALSLTLAELFHRTV